MRAPPVGGERNHLAFHDSIETIETSIVHAPAKKVIDRIEKVDSRDSQIPRHNHEGQMSLIFCSHLVIGKPCEQILTNSADLTN